MAYIAVLNTLKPEQGSTVFYICGIVWEIMEQKLNCFVAFLYTFLG